MVLFAAAGVAGQVALLVLTVTHVALPIGMKVGAELADAGLAFDTVEACGLRVLLRRAFVGASRRSQTGQDGDPDI